MKRIWILFLTWSVLAAVSYAQMRCAPGKCGGGTPASTKKTLLPESEFPIPIIPHRYRCAYCNMSVEIPEYAAEIMTRKRDVYFFDAIGCMVLWLTKHENEVAKMVTQSLDTHRWIDPKKAWYTRTAHDPMRYGFAAFEHKKEGLISYEEMRLLMLRGKTLRNPDVKKEILKSR